MAVYYDELPEDAKLIEWIKKQALFHVGTAPLKGEHINVSPKGQETFVVVNRKAVWYLDLSGSGNETISHLYENGRLVIMFEAFQGPPRILRLYGKGRVIERGTPEFDRLMSTGGPEYGFPPPQMLPGARAIIWLDITRIGTSCGYAVPYMKFEGNRNTLNDEFEKREEGDAATDDPHSLHFRKGLQSYWAAKNSWSLDGLPGVKSIRNNIRAERVDEVLRGCRLTREDVFGRKRMPRADFPSGILVGIVIGLVLALLLQRVAVLPGHGAFPHLCIANHCLFAS